MITSISTRPNVMPQQGHGAAPTQRIDASTMAGRFLRSDATAARDQAVESASMIPIWDKGGSAVAWLDGDLVRDSGGNVKAWINGEHVFNSSTIGFLHNGFFRDTAGDAVAFVEGAHGGPSLPSRGPKPYEPYRAYEPYKPYEPYEPYKPYWSMSWSSTSWNSYISR